MRLLIADDDEVTRNLLEEIFVSEKFQVYTAKSGEEAINLLSRESFNIVLSDIRMLDLDGMGVLSFAKQELPTVMILMTGFGSMETAIDAIQKRCL